MQISQRDGWGFIQNLVETYGPFSTLHGFFGVRPFPPLSCHLADVVCGNLVYVVTCL